MRSRYDGYVDILHIGKEKAYTKSNDSFPTWRWTETSDLLPLVEPQPKYRPFKPVEAVEHLGRRYVKKTEPSLVRTVDAVEHFGIRSWWDNRVIAYKEFVEQCTWADDSSPCGVVEDGN